MRRKITERIESWAKSDERTALMVSGARQVGKTYSIREFGQRVYKEHFLEINLQDESDTARIFEGGLDADTIIRNISARYLDFEFLPGRTLIFLDEIQSCPRARTALKPLAEDGRCRIIASGSLLGIRMGEVPLNPVGYLSRMVMHPLDFEEFLWALGMPQGAIDDVREKIRRTEPIDSFLFDRFSELFRQYMVVGGMPKAVSRFIETKNFSGLRSIFDELFEGYADDISRYADNKDKPLIRRCLEYVPSMLACENKRFMFGRIRDIDDSKPGTKAAGFSYFAPALEWLSMADITMMCNRVSEPVSPLEERCQPNMFKLYMLDTGILVSRYDSSVFEEVFFGDVFANMGSVAENIVAQAFESQGRRLMYLSKNSGLEVDFVTVVGGMPCCVEVKSGDNRHCRSLNRAMAEYGCAGLMFETRNVFVDGKGVRHLPLFAASFMDAVDPRNDRTVDRSPIDEIRRMYLDRRRQASRPSPSGSGLALDACSSIHLRMSAFLVEPIPKYSENFLVVVSSSVCPERLPETKSISIKRWTSSYALGPRVLTSSDWSTGWLYAMVLSVLISPPDISAFPNLPV